MFTSSLSNKLKKDVILTISSILCKSFGPNSQMTLLCTSTGKVVTTNDGMTILEALHLSHPLAKLVVQSLRKHHSFTRDGTKTFLHYLSQAMTELDKLQMQSSPLGSSNYSQNSCWNRISMQLARIERDILPQIWNELYARSLVRTVEDFSLDDLKNVIATTLSSQLNRGNSQLFEGIILETLIGRWCKEIPDFTLTSIQKKVDFMLQNFDFLQLKLSKHLVDSSSALRGFLLRQDFTLKPSHQKESSTLRYVLLLCSIEGYTCKDPSEIIHLKNQETAHTALSHRLTTARMYVNGLKDCEVSLVLCSEKVPDYVVAICRDFDIGIISCVDEEDVHFLERVTGTQAITSPYDSVDRRHIGVLSGCDRKVLGTQRFVHLQFLEEVNKNLPEMIVIAAPTDGMVDQLTSVIYKTYKSIQMCFAIHDCFTYSVFRHEKSSETRTRISDAKDPHHQSNISEFTAVGGGGFFEIQTADLLRNHSKNFSDLDTGLGCKILHDCLLSVPRSLHKQLTRNSTTEARDYIQKLQSMGESMRQGSVVGLDRRGRVCNPHTVGILEPLASKISTFASVVQLLQQLIRVDSIVSVRKLGEPQSDSDD